MRPLVWFPLLAASCNQLLGTPEARRGACDPRDAFDHAAPVGGIESGLGIQSAALSRDELTVVFSRLTVGGGAASPIARRGDLYTAHRDHLADAFRGAAPLDELNTELDEHSASLSDDQQTVYFDRQGPSGRYQIWTASRSGSAGPFGLPTAVALGDLPGSNLQPFLTSSTLYVAARQDDGAASLFAAARSGSSFTAPRRLASLETLPVPAYENPVVSSDELTIYFSAPPDNATPQDIWTASRAGNDQPFGTPHALAELDSVSAERPTWLSADSCRLYFVTNRTGQGFQLWVASR